MNRFRDLTCAVCCVFLAGAIQAEDWPHWRGVNRNGHTTEPSGWDGTTWNLKEVWKANVGEGSTSPIVIDGHLYTMGWKDGSDIVRCLNASSGKVLWEKSYPSPRYGRVATGDQGLYSGPTSTPEFDSATGLLFTLGVDGDLKCWETKQEGKLVWDKNLYEEYNPPQRPKVNRSSRRDYGYTSSPLVYKEWVIVEVGAKAGNLIAFDKRTGQQRWASQATDPAGHNGGPVPMTVAGVPCLAVHHFNGLLVVRLDKGHTGETVATYPWRTNFANNIATVVVEGEDVLLTSAYNHFKIARLRISLGKSTKIWEQKFASKVCTPIIHEGHVYWAWQKVMCLDFETGSLKWEGGKIGDPGSCILTGDQRLIVLSGRGNLSLVETAGRSPNRYQELASRKGLFRTDAWPHVVLAAGRLYCKDRKGNLICFKVR